MRFSFWPGVDVDPADLEIYVTLTRYTDLANNSDKWRRFITLGHNKTANLRPYTFTQTGRWTHLTARGDWSGGTVRTGGLLSAASWRRSGYNVRAAHDGMVNSKRKDYTAQNAMNMGWSDCQALFNRLGPSNPCSVGQTRPVIQAAPVTPAPRPGTPLVQPMTPATGVHDRLAFLLDLANTDGVDPFDLFADLAVLKKDVEVEVRRVEELQSNLRLVNEIILNKV